MTGPTICRYDPAEWDSRGFWIARCPKHPEAFRIDIADRYVTGYHIVMDDDSETSP